MPSSYRDAYLANEMLLWFWLVLLLCLLLFYCLVYGVGSVFLLFSLCFPMFRFFFLLLVPGHYSNPTDVLYRFSTSYPVGGTPWVPIDAAMGAHQWRPWVPKSIPPWVPMRISHGCPQGGPSVPPMGAHGCSHGRPSVPPWVPISGTHGCPVMAKLAL